IDRPPVVRIDQAERPLFAALVQVGHAGHRELERELCERVAKAERRQPRRNAVELVDERIRLARSEQRIDEPLHRILVRGLAARGWKRGKRSAQRFGSSASTFRRARRSSARLLSWVDVDSIECGRKRSRIWLAAWNAAAEMPNVRGSPPTSLSDSNRT